MSHNDSANDNENDDNSVLNKKHHRIMPQCQLCKTKESKYVCPRCQTKTCSVQCVKDHKKKFGCSGQRDKYRLVNEQKDYNEKTFYRDMNYLSNTINGINTSNKKIFCLMENSSKETEENDRKQQAKLNKNFKRICKKFRLITLHKCPEYLQRAKENKSYLDSNTKKIYWTVKFTFIGSGKGNEKGICEHLFSKKTFDDDITSLNDVICYMNEHRDDISNAELLSITSHVDWLEKYEIYYKMNNNNMDIIDKEKYFCYEKIYYDHLDKSLSLKDLLKNKDVYEYPEFFFILKQ